MLRSINIKSLSVAVSTLVLSTSANSALLERLGGLAYYDDVADLTWLADANYAKTSGYDTDGQMTWQAAVDWAAQLTVGGAGGWRLADTIDVGNDGATYTNRFQGVDYGFNITTHSELSNMFYNVLGNTAYYDTSGVATGCTTAPNYCLTNTGPFSNLQPYYYWSATESASNTNNAWYFRMDVGVQEDGFEYAESYGWAVQSGDVSTVPVPAAAWLFGSGLLGLVGVARRKQSA
jgi:hypothetical protein